MLDRTMSLNPPKSSGERIRDGILKALDHPVAQALGIIVLVLVIIDGAFFFFLLVGWQTMCRPRVDCEPRNWWYVFSVQLLTVLISYTATISMPWRCANLLHISGWACPPRENSAGHDLYGRVNHDPWFSIPRPRRLGITLLLLANSLAQFANQATKIIYYNYELQSTYPGNVWTSVFFGSSFLCVALAGVWMAYETSVLRKQNPNKFGPGPIDLAKQFYTRSIKKIRGGKDSNADVSEALEVERDIAIGSEVESEELPRRSITDVERSSMRLWGM